MTRATHRTAIAAVLLVLATGLAGCPGDTPAEREAVVDSALALDTLLARFRTGLERPAALRGGAPSLDELVARFGRAVAASDTAAFRALALTREEFAWLYYPELPEAAPPYELEPALLWFMIETGSGRGLRTLLAERGGRPLEVTGYTCQGERRHGAITLWGPCVLHRLEGPGDTVTEALFGPVVSRGGRLKFVSYANKL